MFKTLVFIPTYNERENAQAMYRMITALELELDLLFLDDNSPDGTGALLDEIAGRDQRVHVIHRSGKLGIGSAHAEGIGWAFERGYQLLVTMDCDFTHSPSDISKLLDVAKGCDVVVGSRYLQEGSLPGWSLCRRFITHFGHLVTRTLLHIPFDASGAFRVYDLTKIPRDLFASISSKGYAFFPESLFFLGRNNFSIREVPIILPARTYGHSKMTTREVFRSASIISRLALEYLINPRQFRICPSFSDPNPDLVDDQGWDEYWRRKEFSTSFIYGMIASVYRNFVIRRRLNIFVHRHFPPGSHLLHAGSGSGQVDSDIQNEMEITAVDISVRALQVYRRNNPNVRFIRHADILSLPFPNPTFDGAYNLGVLEHFTEAQIKRILSEFYRVIKKGGKVIIFWPHARASSVFILKIVHWVLNRVLKRNVQLHPAEICLLRSKSAVEQLFRETGFTVVDYYFGARDLFVQAVFVLQKS
jgi:dolichol-phosphate mannosyltransferase